jgi:predicted MPP superfamily phosphohydrolase
MTEPTGQPVPIVCVLGNHDCHSDAEDLVRKVLEEAGVTVVEGEHAVVDIGGRRIGIAGTKASAVASPARWRATSANQR